MLPPQPGEERVGGGAESEKEKQVKRLQGGKLPDVY